MDRVVTISERKEREAARRKQAAEDVMAELRTFAHETGGRFLVFGSVAGNRVRYNSDIDIMIDFPPDLEPQAWNKVEDLCRKKGIRPDIHSTGWSKPAFVQEVSRAAIVLE